MRVMNKFAINSGERVHPVPVRQYRLLLSPGSTAGQSEQDPSPVHTQWSTTCMQRALRHAIADGHSQATREQI